MKTFVYFTATVITSITALCACNNTPQNQQNQENDRDAIEKVIDLYCESINTCDTTICSRIWSHADNVSFIAPSGYYQSYEDIRDSLVTGLFGRHFTERRLMKEHLKISINGNNAWSEFRWQFNATRNDGTAHNTKGNETQIFEKDNDGQWRLVHIHYSSSK